jgi:membrane dipeptidase
MDLPTINNNLPSQPSIIIDMHADTLLRVVDEQYDLATPHQHGHIDLPRMRQGGVTAQFFSIWVHPQPYPGQQAVNRSWQLINALKSQIARHGEQLALVTTADELTAVVASGKIAAAMGIEGGHSLNGQIRLLEEFFCAGVRYMTLTWSNTNQICGSSGDQGRDQGLTPFGREVVQLMNRLGMMVDISHVSDRAFYEVLETTTRPAIASHSNLRRICRHPRNLTDEMLRALAAQGGVCCINFYPVFLDDNYYTLQDVVHTRIMEALARHQDPARIYQEEFGKLAPVTVAKVADHIEQAVEIAGVDHIGIGSDFDGIPATPQGLENVAQMPNLRAELRRRGFQETDLAKIFGLNVLRVFAAAQINNSHNVATT